MIRIFILALSALALSGCIVDGHRGRGGYDHGHDNDRGHYSCPPGGCGHNPGDNNGNWHR
ncbi:hypothetical protein KVP10_11120 [Candidimonas humi]|jgi:hypothetical protein|uniref:Lipoprotein n=1 Tax=Candidimonas humi TaxID=683355 RepID=A0ABV8P047_9BURK|nr:hypothetical protein [Candidimonas humi]MBV6305439.1 hypothetical protein [Candidimonas humi]